MTWGRIYLIKLEKILLDVSNPYLVRALGSFYSFYVSIRYRRPLSINFDGVDWIHKVNAINYCFEKPNFHFIEVIEECERLSTTHYQPKKGDVVLDVGAGIGEQIPFFSKLVGDCGKVFAIEANPEASRRLKKTICVNNLRNVEVLEIAISNRKEEGWIEESSFSKSNRYFSQERPIGTKSAAVTSRSLDSVIDEIDITEIDLLKINIEGAEVLALQGLKKHKRIINHWVISCHDFLLSEDMKTFKYVNDWLERSGFVILESPYSRFRLDSASRRYQYDYLAYYVFAQANLRSLSD